MPDAAAAADAAGGRSSPLALCAGYTYALDVDFGGALVNALITSSTGRLSSEQRPAALEAVNAAARALGLLNLYIQQCPNRYITPVVTRVANLLLQLPEDAAGTVTLKATSASGPFDAFRSATATLPVLPKQQCETSITNPDKSADYLVEASKGLEHAVSQLSLCSLSAALPAALPTAASSISSSCKPPPQQLGALAAFDLSLLRYQERDALLETFQRYRHKAGFDMSKAWDGRCRKWYADRYDFRTNMVDWDYHMRLSPRGTPFMDPAAGSIVHFQHFRHWRLTGVAHELRGSAYTAANSSLLSTAYGRSKEYKDRQLRDVGRSVSAFGFWADILNGPYHAFGTVADDARLFKITNKQFVHTAVDVAEHNLLPSAANSQQQQLQQQQQQQQDDELARLAALEAATTAASIERFVSSTKIFLLCGDLKRSLTSKPKFAGKFAAATVGHRHVHLLSPETGLAGVLQQPGGAVFVETGQNMVQLNDEQTAAFKQRAAELAAPAGFERHPAFGGGGSSSKDATQQQQSCSQCGAAAAAAAAAGAVAGWRLPPGHMALRVACQAGSSPSASA
ncbi:hypothetical protein OEZ86_003610 [Tetradesmus obliquus]|nr:hypothetical protein OEZ86_003610 [Tetradesmus obliquus]